MTQFRIKRHPILSIPKLEEIHFNWQGNELSAHKGETIASALFANGIRIFGHHPKDGSPQGLFCANGQCSQCMVLADGKPVKSCMELVRPGMTVSPAEGLPEMPKVGPLPSFKTPRLVETDVLILGGGPAGLSAGIELGKLGIHAILIDDKHRMGGKLVLQTHRFFGSTYAVYAGTRGIDIATRLEKEIRKQSTIEIWPQTTALAVFSDQKVGVLRNGEEYVLVQPKVLLVATGAREKFLAFQGNSLPGVYGAGAFQTLVNRDLVRPAEKLFIVGGGNVGLIAGYHALQADISVVGLVEALPECGGYKVHKDKLARMGIPIYTSHTILSANGKDQVESVTIARIDEKFKPIAGTERTFECDSVLIAVGLDPVNEFFHKAEQYGLPAFSAGDAEEIAEASAAMFSGKIKGREIANYLGVKPVNIPAEWYKTGEILKSKPGSTFLENLPETSEGVLPVIHCTQEIPCNPCSTICPNGLIFIEDGDIRKVPEFQGDAYSCESCEQCVAGCPGLAITLLDYNTNHDFPLVSIPYEFTRDRLHVRDRVTVLDTGGECLGELEVVGIHDIPSSDRTLIVQVQAPREYASRIAGIRIQDQSLVQPLKEPYVTNVADETIVCRCERVTAGEIRELIRKGFRDMNEIKTVTRAGMGACGAKTCTELVHRLFREEGIPLSEVTDQVKRPLFIEVSLGVFAGQANGTEEEKL